MMPLHGYIRVLHHLLGFPMSAGRCPKRDKPTAQVLRLWEALWSGHLTPHFHLFLAAGVLGLHRRAIMEVRFPCGHIRLSSTAQSRSHGLHGSWQ